MHRLVLLNPNITPDIFTWLTIAGLGMVAVCLLIQVRTLDHLRVPFEPGRRADAPHGGGAGLGLPTHENPATRWACAPPLAVLPTPQAMAGWFSLRIALIKAKFKLRLTAERYKRKDSSALERSLAADAARTRYGAPKSPIIVLRSALLALLLLSLAVAPFLAAYGKSESEIAVCRPARPVLPRPAFGLACCPCRLDKRSLAAGRSRLAGSWAN